MGDTGTGNQMNCLELIINLWKESLGNSCTDASWLNDTVSLKLLGQLWCSCYASQLDTAVPICRELLCLLSVQTYVVFRTYATYNLAGRPESCNSGSVCSLFAWFSVLLIIRPWSWPSSYSDQYSKLCEVGVTGSGAHILLMPTSICDGLLVICVSECGLNMVYARFCQLWNVKRVVDSRIHWGIFWSICQDQSWQIFILRWT